MYSVVREETSVLIQDEPSELPAFHDIGPLAKDAFH